MPKGGAVPAEALVTLRRKLAALPEHHPERGALMKSTAELYAVSRATLYRLLHGGGRPKDAHRTDRRSHTGRRCQGRDRVRHNPPPSGVSPSKAATFFEHRRWSRRGPGGG